MRFHVVRWTALALGAAALLASAAAWAAPAVSDFRVRCTPGAEPSAYLRFQGKELRIAATQEGLDAAQPVKSQHTETYRSGPKEMTQVYSFPEVEIPGAAADTTVKATLSYQRQVQSTAKGAKVTPGAGVYGQFQISRKDSAGVVWTYVTSAGVGPEGGGGETPTLDLPDVSKLTLSVEAKPGEDANNIGIGLHLTAAGGMGDVSNVLKDGKAVPAHVEITDKEGKSIHSQRGNLEKFSFG